MADVGCSCLAGDMTGLKLLGETMRMPSGLMGMYRGDSSLLGLIEVIRFILWDLELVFKP
ncbi:hypothetical protein DPMN_114268 [Dreissena polymorpha]|uniref:Uncharacterized protein n=1 Tax=Dreissena polymorpha TaxID=45954 RepID=A0A9D4QSA7_DREPO|nr:hypothetical protein DPMN_114268 [Dreissena polymorpha]